MFVFEIKLKQILKQQEDTNEQQATNWPDYYIDRLNSMSAVSSCLLPFVFVEAGKITTHKRN